MAITTSLALAIRLFCCGKRLLLAPDLHNTNTMKIQAKLATEMEDRNLGSKTENHGTNRVNKRASRRHQQPSAQREARTHVFIHEQRHCYFG